ncbi:hypothetical protein ETD83_19410 [Actinomadura soli]|uniref:Peptidase inhibitor family I36 n=1 Tax=Actinomadura soli TaxID=2508997 RepID=A0A5C4JAW0_9ACTN|nr:hypothetical protein [Actinomadura soli]TMQ98326.1 hypothetical protein ETD83_19410 [Actinomadura soli]
MSEKPEKGAALKSRVRKLVVVAGVSSALVAPMATAPAAHAGSGEVHKLKHGKCASWGRYVNGYSFNYGDSHRTKGKCWHWVKIWVHDFKKKRNYTLVAQGTKAVNITAFTPPGRLATRRGHLVYRLELGLCGTAKSCVSKRYRGARI